MRFFDTRSDNGSLDNDDILAEGGLSGRAGPRQDFAPADDTRCDGDLGQSGCLDDVIDN
jgi:hypothetical protein